MSLRLAAAGAGAGFVYMLSGWDGALTMKNNALVVGMRLFRVWEFLLGKPHEVWRPVMDRLDRVQAMIFKARVHQHYKTETVSVPVQGGNINVHLCSPLRQTHEDAKLPMIVWFHGGGMVLNQAQDPMLTAGPAGFGILEHFKNKVVIASVEYRRAPEHTFPVGVEDAIAATNFLSSNASRFGADSARLCVAGFSAGGYLASVVHQAARDRDFPLQCAVILSPMLRRGATTSSYIENGHYSDLPTRAAIWFWSLYSPEAHHATDPRCTPILGIASGKLAPCIVATGKFDVLRDEGVEYYEALRIAGVEADHFQSKTTHISPALDYELWQKVLQRWSALLGITTVDARL